MEEERDGAVLQGGDGEEEDILLRCEDVRKTYKGNQALDGVSLEVRSGEIYGIAGLNGAGKSTLLTMLAGILPPDSGQVFYRDADVFGQDGSRNAARELRVGYVPQEIALFPELSVQDNILFWALAAKYRRRAKKDDVKERVRRVAKYCGLFDRLRAPVASLSGGMKRRVNIASALVTGPEALIMDEPTVGLDARNRRDILAFIQSLAKRRKAGKGLAVILTSHQSGELESICDRILLLNRGVVLFEGTLDEILDKYKGLARPGERIFNVDDILYRIGDAARP